MLRVTIEIVPNRDEAKARKVGEIQITNTTSSLAARLDTADSYSAYAVEEACDSAPRVARRAVFSHFHADGALACIGRALRSLGK